MDQAERDAIDAGKDFVNGDFPWPSAWVETFDYKGFTYRLKANSQGHAVYYGEWHIGQVKRYGTDPSPKVDAYLDGITNRKTAWEW